MLWETGQADRMEHKMLHCSYDNKTCYYAKTIPVIHELSSNTGYISGGQNLTVKGYGFGSGNIVAKVGDLPCTVTSYDKYQFSCTVKDSPAVSDLTTTYVGQHGIKNTLVNTTIAANKVSLATIEDTTETDWIRTNHLSVELESHELKGDFYGQIFKGWFIPPATTDYKFYMSCDDHCELKLSKTPNDITAPTSIIKVDGASTFRQYFKDNDGRQRSSAW